MIIFHDKNGNRLAITEAEALALGYTYEHKMSEKVNPKWTSLNANELADTLQREKPNTLLYVATIVDSANMLRQQQAEIEFLKKEILAKHEDWKHEGQQAANAKAEIEELKLAKKVILRYAEKDIAKYRAEVEELKKQLALWRLSKSSEEIEQVGTNPTFMGVLDEPVGHLYPEGEGVTVYDIKFAWKVTGTTEPIPLYTHPAKTLTDEEITQVYIEEWGNGEHVFARSILRKAQEK